MLSSADTTMLSWNCRNVEEQAMLDDHDEKVTELTDWLQQLVLEPKGRSPSDIDHPSKLLHKQLDRDGEEDDKILKPRPRAWSVFAQAPGGRNCSPSWGLS